MLAERKQKMKWCPNPCGNFWAKDDNKFGQKILEKFGWSPGKGLGAQEQGITDPVKLKCNSTQKGLGYERGNKPEFFQHQEEFNSILLELNSSESSSDSKKEKHSSLEEKSKKCKTRVHYHKFTRGKDLSRYSEKDLSCILGGLPAVEMNNTVIDSSNSSKELNEINDKEFYCETLNSSLITNEEVVSNDFKEKCEMVKVTKKKKKRKVIDLEENIILENTEMIENVTLINNEIIQTNHQIVLEDNLKKKNQKRQKRKCAAIEDDIVNDISNHVYELNGINNFELEIKSQPILDCGDKKLRKKKKHKKNKM